MLIEISNFSISEIKKFSKLECKYSELTHYLSRYAQNHSKKGLFKTYILKIDEKIIGYISFSIATIESSSKIQELTSVSKNIKYSLPSLKITRLCVFEEYKKQGFGSVFITFAEILALIQQIQTGCRMLLVDSKIDAENFYKKNGFLKVNNDKTTIFMLKKVITPNEFKKMNNKEIYLENIKKFCKIFNLDIFYLQIKEYFK